METKKNGKPDWMSDGEYRQLANTLNLYWSMVHSSSRLLQILMLSYDFSGNKVVGKWKWKQQLILKYAKMLKGLYDEYFDGLAELNEESAFDCHEWANTLARLNCKIVNATDKEGKFIFELENFLNKNKKNSAFGEGIMEYLRVK